jgi:uncharacterized protein YegL
MPNDKKTLIVAVLDRSGSMQSILSDAVGGFNTFLAEQQKLTVDECRMTVAMFDDQYELLYNNVPIADVQPFTETSYAPRGMTALYDAIGKTINNVGKELDALPENEKPGKVLFVILTDGMENKSSEFKCSDTMKLIKQQSTQWKWEFIYLAADEAGMQQGMALGIQNSANYATSSVMSAHQCFSACASSYRSVGSVGSFSHTV